MRALFYKIFYRPLPFFQWFNQKRHRAIIKALSQDATLEDQEKMEQLQRLTSWMMLPMTIIDTIHFWSIKRNVMRMNKHMEKAGKEFLEKWERLKNESK